MKNRIYRTPQGQAKVMELYDDILGTWPEAEHMYVQTGFGKTFLLAVGDKNLPPVFLLHGSCANALAWRVEAMELCRRFRVYIPDIPGEPGKSVAVRARKDEGKVLAQWFLEVMDQLGVGTARMVGNSLGGWVLLEAAARCPERFEALALLAPGGIVDVRLSFCLMLFLLLAGQRGQRYLASRMLDGVELDGRSQEVIRVIGQNFRPRTGRLYVPDRLLCHVNVKTLVLVGQRDVCFSGTKMGSRASRVMPCARVEILEGKGHTLVGMAGRIMEFFA